MTEDILCLIAKKIKFAKKYRIDMKKFLLMLAAALSIGVSANAETTALGYCAGECAKSGSVSTEGNAWVSGAIYVPATLLGNYDGAEIVGLRAGLASKMNLDCLQMWVRSELDGDNLALVELTSSTDPKIAKGWNEVTLEKPVTINSSEGLYIGMTYHQKAATNAFSTVGTGVENGFFVKWGEDAEWQDISDTGVLSVEALVSGAASYDYDLGLLSAVMDPNADPANNRMNVKLVNNGTERVEGFTLATTYTRQGNSYENTFDVAVPAGEKIEVVYEVPKIGSLVDEEVTVNIVALANGTDRQEANNSITAVSTFRKKVLVEEFTTERCSNCPRVAGYLHTVLATDEFKDVAVAVCHHAGYYTDLFTQPCDEEMEWIYGGGLYAPAMMFDRAPLFNEGKKVVTSPTLEDIEENIRLRLAEPAGVSIALKAIFDESTGKLTLNVEGKRQQLTLQNPTLTVYITEDGVESLMQAGADGDFYHDHLIRAYNSTWGDPITWNGNNFSNEYVFEIDPEWNKKTLKAVAVVGNYNSENYKDCVVNNVECVSLFTGNSNVTGAIAEKTVQHEIWTNPAGFVIDGDTYRGVAIKTTLYSDGSKKSVKIVR